MCLCIHICKYISCMYIYTYLYMAACHPEWCYLVQSNTMGNTNQKRVYSSLARPCLARPGQPWPGLTRPGQAWPDRPGQAVNICKSLPEGYSGSGIPLKISRLFIQFHSIPLIVCEFR